MSSSLLCLGTLSRYRTALVSWMKLTRARAVFEELRVVGLDARPQVRRRVRRLRSERGVALALGAHRDPPPDRSGSCGGRGAPARQRAVTVFEFHEFHTPSVV